MGYIETIGMAGSERGTVRIPRSAQSARGRAILAAHPELRGLLGPSRATAGWIAATFAFQIAIAAAVADAPWWVVVGAAYLVGAFASLGLWTLLHECTHDLVFRRTLANRWCGIVCGLPLVLPCAASFRSYHILHHRHPGDPILADVPSKWEVQVVCASAWRKALWLMAAPVLQCLRTGRMRQVTLFDRWALTNIAVQIAFNAMIVVALGWAALTYLLLSNLFCLGLHSLGARLIQEHFELVPQQETYSYYGPINRLVFNAGYHCEHHDIPRVAWHRLPVLRATAPEFYEHRHAYQSWTKLLARFLFDPQISLASRAVRPGQCEDAR